MLLHERTYACALIDKNLPDMSGLEVTRNIREQERATHAHIPIIALTAHAFRESRSLCLTAGMDGWITKPIDSRQLHDAMEKLLGRPAA